MLYAIDLGTQSLLFGKICSPCSLRLLRCFVLYGLNRELYISNSSSDMLSFVADVSDKQVFPLTEINGSLLNPIDSIFKSDADGHDGLKFLLNWRNSGFSLVKSLSGSFCSQAKKNPANAKMVNKTKREILNCLFIRNVFSD